MCLVYLKPLGPAFMPAGKKTPVAGEVRAPFLKDEPPVTMFSTWLVVRAVAMAKVFELSADASTMRVAVTFEPPASDTWKVARPKSSGLGS